MSRVENAGESIEYSRRNCGYVVIIADPSAHQDPRLRQGLQVLADIISEKAYSEYELEN